MENIFSGCIRFSICWWIILYRIIFPNDYPYKGPEIRFLTSIYHLNVNSKDLNSYGCPLGLVKPSFILGWKYSTIIKEILMKLFSIFYLTNPDSSLDLEMAN